MKKIPNPPRRCIFCGGTPITKEHIFAAWMRDFLPTIPNSRTDHDTSLGRRDLKSGKIMSYSTSKGKLDKPGDHRSRGLRVVCRNCNNGWMSEIQNIAKPILIPFLKGQWPRITQDDQYILSVWAAMFSMVFEFAHPETVGISQDHRTFLKEFKQHKTMPKNWFVWIGQFDDQSRNLPIWHRGLGIFKEDTQIPDGITKPMNTQMTLFAAGGIVFLTFSTCVDDEIFSTIQYALRTTEQSFGFRRIWPTSMPHTFINGLLNRRIIHND